MSQIMNPDFRPSHLSYDTFQMVINRMVGNMLSIGIGEDQI